MYVKYVCMYVKYCAQLMALIRISIKELCNCLLVQCHPCPHLTSVMSVKSNWCPANCYLASIFSDSDF